MTAGAYNLSTSGTTWGTQYISGVLVSAGATASGENFAFSAEAGIAGLVKINGAPAVGAQVIATDSNGNSTGVLADATGAYSLTGLSAGPWSFVIGDPGYAPFQAALQLLAGVITQEPTVSLAVGRDAHASR